jgi:hypothetical protein
MDYFTTTDPLYVCNLILHLAMFLPSSVLYVVVLSTHSPNACYHINIKLVKVHITSGVVNLAIFLKYCLIKGVVLYCIIKEKHKMFA